MPLREYMDALKPGDKMNFSVQKMKPTWLSEQSQGASAQPAAPAASPAPMPTQVAPPPPPMPSLGGSAPAGMDSIIAAMQRRRGY